MLDRAALAGERMKAAAIRTKEKAADKPEEDTASPGRSATEQVTETARAGGKNIMAVAAAQGRKRLSQHQKETENSSLGPEKGTATVPSANEKFTTAGPPQHRAAEQGRQLAMTQARERSRKQSRATTQSILPTGSEIRSLTERGIKQGRPIGARPLGRLRRAEARATKKLNTAQQTAQTAQHLGRNFALRKAQKQQWQRTIWRSGGTKGPAVVRQPAQAAGRAAKGLAAAGEMTASLTSGGWIVVVVVLVCLVGLVIGSCFGISLANEDSGMGLTLSSAMVQLDTEFGERIEAIKGDYAGQYSSVILDGAATVSNWRDILAVYAVRTTTKAEGPTEVATMTESKLDLLREILWDMNQITASLESDGEGAVLHITVTGKTYLEAADIYHFDQEQKALLEELIQSGILDGLIGGDSAADSGTGTPGTGGFLWPLPGYTAISSPFAYRICPYHGMELHGGVDLPAPAGTSILAAKGGTVVTSTYGSSYGNHIIIAHPDGTRTLYAHMSARLVSVGSTVTQGQVIGNVGSTGNSTGNHLHFEIWTGSSSGSRVDPMGYF
jgi:murein DD-endopeptidase MepM/ murein hydrolase activator NlpD